MERSAVDTFNESLRFCDTSTNWPHILVNIVLSYILVRGAYQSFLDCLSSQRNLGKGGRMKNTACKFRIQDLEPSLCRRSTFHKAFNETPNFLFSGLSFPCESMKILLYCCWTHWHYPAIYIWQLLCYQDHLPPGPSVSHICLPCYPREIHRIKSGTQTKKESKHPKLLKVGIGYNPYEWVINILVSLSNFYCRLVQDMVSSHLHSMNAWQATSSVYELAADDQDWRGLSGPYSPFSSDCRHHII